MLTEIERKREEEILENLEALRSWETESRFKNGMQFYVPNMMQKEAHNSRAQITLFCGGNRSGKSTFGAMELAYHLKRDYPEWYPMHRRYNRPIKAIISATEYPIVTRVIEPKLLQYLPRDYYHIQRSPHGFLSRITCVDGSTVDILTSEMKDEAYESADWDFAWCDEPQHQRKYQAILRGLVDRKGRMVITFTPLTEPWMKEELVDKADGKHIEVFQVDIRQNRFTVSGDPILSEDAIEAFEASLPEDVKETRIHGKFFHMRGTVYKEFGDAHLMEFSYQYPNPVICVLDPHDRNPHHVIWAYLDRDDDIFVDYELITHCELDELARRIIQVEKARGYRMRRRIIDPNFGRKPASSGNNRSVMDELHRFGASFGEGDDNVELGHMVVRDFLHFDLIRPVTAVNKPKLFFSRDRTPVTIRSMRNHQYQDWQGKTKEDRDPKEMQKDKDTHGADCIRYLCISRPTYGRMTERVQDELAQAPY